MLQRKAAKEIRARLEQWLPIDQFERELHSVEEVFGEFAPLRSLGSAPLGFWRDGKICASYAKFRDATMCRLCPEERPDFEIVLRGITYRYEATEVDRPSRRRGLEFDRIIKLKAAGESTVTQDPEEHWLTPELARSAIGDACRRKLLKDYEADCGLVIYLNWSDYGFHHQQIVDVFQDATSAASTKFASIDILWSGELHQIWDLGRKKAHA